MNIPSFMLNQDLSSLLITLAGQSIIVSLIGIAAIRLLSKRSAPVRSLVCTATIAALGLLLVISIGFRSSGISWHQTHLPVFLEETAPDPILSSGLDKSLSSPLPLPFESLSPAPLIQSQASNDKGVVPSTPSQPSFSIQLSPPISLFINGLGFIWLMGIMSQLVKLGYNFVLMKKFRNSLYSVHGTFLNDMVRNVAGTFWNNRLPELYSSPLIESPIAIGLVNPIVIIPQKLFDTLSENELKSILLHELSHIYHYDQAMGVIKRVVMALHWWNLVVYRINRYHEQAREEVSDNYVLHEIHPRVYTRCLVDLAEKVCLISSLPTAVGMAGGRFDLRVRVEQLLSKKRRVVMKTRVYLKAITFSICLVLTFIIAGFHARVNAEAFDYTETPSAINSASIFEDERSLSQKNITEPEAVEVPTPDNMQATSYTVAMLQAESSNKQVQENVGSIRVPTSAGTKAKEIAEKQSDSGTIQSVGDTIPKDEAEDAKTTIQNEDFEKAFELLGPLAEENHAEAQFLLGSLYINGQGVEKDDTKGLSWIMKSARQGYDQARLRAFSIYLEIAGRGDASAMYNLGYMCLHGWGGEQDTDVGIGWLESAVKNGHVRSAKVLSGIYAEGKFGITPDRDKASFWSNLSAESAASIDRAWSREAPVQGGPPTEPTFDSDAREYISEDITAEGERFLHSLRMEMIRAEDLKFEIFNSLNSTDEFDITCEMYTPTGSRIPRRVCDVGYMKKARREDARLFIDMMEEPGENSFYQGFLLRPEHHLTEEFAHKAEALKKEMVELGIKHPSLGKAMIDEYELRQRYDVELRKRSKDMTLIKRPEEHFADELKFLNVAYLAYNDGMMEEHVWHYWDKRFRSIVHQEPYRSIWLSSNTETYADVFVAYVNRILSGG